MTQTASIENRWGVKVGFKSVLDAERKSGSDHGRPVTLKKEDDALPSELLWHSELVFEDLDDAWETVYGLDAGAVLISRAFGSGRIVLMSDSYPLSNEALARDRSSELLSWLIGPNRAILFDETHLGVMERPGIASLFRAYRLQGLLIALMGWVGLFIWRNAVSLVPAGRDDPSLSSGQIEGGKECSAGLVALLRRNIRDREILFVCFAEWKKSLPGGPKAWTQRMGAMKDLVDAERARPADARDPIQTYRHLAKILTERKLDSGRQHRSTL